ncbi:hypothetical protein HBI09_032810 [Parastagonospora nodorum]|nr:hypothetical protein HBI09_032810 [Parastagonospora nodorum]KAH4201454.1 hypothetical protein HBH42_029650 [Parastagonospora nodorum]KAH4998791.1 hypothetical protein HBI77_183750 [Parastagonospora nodorum]
MSSTTHHATLTDPSIITAPLPATMDSYYGLSWRQDEGDFGELEDLRPVWTVEPDVEVITKIARCKLDVPAASQCTVEFLAQGAFNKVYTIQCDDNKEYIMRITLPVHPRLKTMSDCATAQYVRHHTDIPAPRVLHYNALRNDELGFEWMIQGRVPGTSLKTQWHQMSWLEKELVVRKVIGYLTQLFRKRFSRMGNIYDTRDLQKLSEQDLPDAILLSADHSTSDTAFSMSEIVSIPFFYNDHGSVDVERGPYKRSHEWLAAQLQFALHDADNVPVETGLKDESSNNGDVSGLFPSKDDNSQLQKDSEDDWCDTDSEISDIDFSDTNTNTTKSINAEDSSDAVLDSDSECSEPDTDSPAAIKTRIARLQAVLPKVFPLTDKDTFILHHQDLSSNNIMLSATHSLNGIIDWECVHTTPLWLACQIPKFLRGSYRDEPPIRDDEFEDEWYEKAYYDDLEDYEKTQLREFFLEEMQRVCPEWMEVFNESGLKADFECAVSFVAEQGAGADIDEWIAAVEEGTEPIELRKELGQC